MRYMYAYTALLRFKLKRHKWRVVERSRSARTRASSAAAAPRSVLFCSEATEAVPPARPLGVFHSLSLEGSIVAVKPQFRIPPTIPAQSGHPPLRPSRT